MSTVTPDPNITDQVLTALNNTQAAADTNATDVAAKAVTAQALATAQANDQNAATAVSNSAAAVASALATLQNLLNQTYGTAAAAPPPPGP
jgi:hypothetical protein